MLNQKLTGASSAANYIEDVFSTYLYTGTGSTQTITNGIDLAGKGGMVWTKGRSTARDPNIVDTVRGGNNMIYTDGTGAQFGLTGLGYSAYTFGATGYTNSGAPVDSENTYTFASWTFRKQPKFFDVVTYTGTGSATTIAHNLGSVPGCIIIKSTNLTSDWVVYHRSLGNTDFAKLNLSNASAQVPNYWNNTSPTSTTFSVNTSQDVNGAGQSYVAYLFAHDAGGFGLTGTDNVISCGSFTADGSGAASVNLGYETQFLIAKVSSTTGNWFMVDTMRGWSKTGYESVYANSSAAASTSTTNYWNPTATGFDCNAGCFPAGATVIYVAIRRGPMKVPTDGTTVYKAIARTGTGAAATVTGVGFPPDLLAFKSRSDIVANAWEDRLRGATSYLYTNQTAAEGSVADTVTSFDMDGFSLGADASTSAFNKSPRTYITNCFKRAPAFFDEVCYTGTGTAGDTYNHNLGVPPELWIVKKRSAVGSWTVGSTSIANSEVLYLQLSDAKTSNTAAWNSTYPTSTVFTVGNSGNTNGSGSTYVAYLFATCAGVSKVGSYTGNGSSQTINCGFTAGARFILIKRTDSTGDWYIWDTVRGIVAGNDPHLSLNSASAEVTTDDSIDSDSSGFIVNQVSGIDVNVSSATYIYLAIA